nr:PD-(D/E)XK nuclease family protein [Lachnospiraceae bacterium]
PDRRIYGTTLPKELIREANRREAVAEEIRLLYVAMTRARDKLIMVGCGDGNSLGGPVRQAGSWDSYLDMLNAAYGPDGFKDIDVSYVLPEDLVYGRLGRIVEKEESADSLMKIVRDHERGRKEEENRIPEFLRYAANEYPYPIDRELRQKLSVSDLKHKAIEEEIARGLELAPDGEQLFAETKPDRYIPAFMRAEGETEKGGTFYGSAFHRIMELWDYSNLHICEDRPGDKKPADGEEGLSMRDPVSSDLVREFTEKMCSLHRMSREQADAIRPDDVAAFLNSALGRRMKSAADAGRLYREQPFVIGMPQGDETVLVQGIIDAYFTEDDGITIVDYKTDRVSDEEMLVNRYRAQLEYYGMALSQIRGLPVRELIIYSTRLRSEIKVTVAKDGRI